MPTAEQQNLIGRLQALLDGLQQIEAAWLAGSLGAGNGDAFSDVDVLVLVADGKLEEGLRAIVTGIGAAFSPVLVNQLFGGRVINVVGNSWERIDFVLVQKGELSRYDSNRLTLLFNRSGATPPARDAQPYSPTVASVRPLAQEFMRVLGLLSVVVGRGEYVIALGGIEHLRRLTVDLMLEDNAVPPAERGGALRRNPLLTREQRSALTALPPISADRDSILEGHRALASIFLPRAKSLAERIGMEWPHDLEAATRAHLLRGVGIVI